MPNRWFAAVIGVLVPPLAFVYLSRWWWVLVYLLAMLAAGWADLTLAGRGAPSGLGLLVSAAASVQAFILARRVRFDGRSRWFNTWWGTLSLPLAFVLVVFITRAFLFDLFRIPSSSMAPTLQPGGYAVMQRWGYGVYGAFGLTLHETEVAERTPPRRGELFVFRPLEMAGQLFVMRVIGLPGDHVQYANKQLIINGGRVLTVFRDEEALADETLGGQSYSVQYLMTDGPGRRFDYVIPEGHFFVMGDNRDNSRDSRYLGMIPAANMVGKIVLSW